MGFKFPVIEPVAAVPAVLAIQKRLDEFGLRQEAVRKRREEVDDELHRRRQRADPAALAERMRAGEPVQFTGQDLAGLEMEAGALATEAAALDAAIGQDERALAVATKQAADIVADRLKAHLADIERRAALKFHEFATIRAERSAIALDLIGKGYAELGVDVAASAIFPTLGSLDEPSAPVSLMVRHLTDRGLVKA